jgi:hypothetical protein
MVVCDVRTLKCFFIRLFSRSYDMTNPLTGIPPTEVSRYYHDRHLSTLSDAELFVRVAELLHPPKLEFSSFTLHAPLEALARFSLLSAIPESRRSSARMQIVSLAARYESIGKSVTSSPRLPGRPSADDVFLTLEDAIASGDLDTADAAGIWIGENISPGEFVVRCQRIMLKYMGAAVHGPIYLSLVARATQTIERAAMAMTRGFTRQLAVESARVLQMPSIRGRAEPALAPEALERLFWQGMVGGEDVGMTDPLGIWKIVDRAVQTGVVEQAMSRAWQEVSEAQWESAMKGIVRGAAHAMIQDTAQHAKYGWTHCLTIPQALWVLGPYAQDKLGVIRLASVVGVGFRHAHGRRKISDDLGLSRLKIPFSEALQQGSREAASVAYFAVGDEVDAIEKTIAEEAAIREDAHLVKYTLACFDSAAMNPAAAPLFRAAAAYLLAIWMADADSGLLLDR